MIDFAACAAASPELNFQWSGNRCRIMLTNTGDAPRRFGEVVLFAGTPGCPASTRFYGEGYSMLSQYQGTLERFESLTPYSDAGHYRLPGKEGFFSCYNLWLLFPAGEPVQLAGFSSCRRFSGKFHFNPERFEAVLELEQLELAPGETVELEEFFTASGPDRETLLAEFAARLAANHSRPGWNGPQPAGWCSWYSYGPEVTERDIFENLAAIRASLPELRFIQIDDGYQAKMGDWLTPHPNFPAGCGAFANGSGRPDLNRRSGWPRLSRRRIPNCSGNTRSFSCGMKRVSRSRRATAPSAAGAMGRGICWTVRTPARVRGCGRCSG